MKKNYYILIVALLSFLFFLIILLIIKNNRPSINQLPPLPDFSASLQNLLDESSQTEETVSEDTAAEKNLSYSVQSSPLITEEERDKVILNYTRVTPNPISSIGQFEAVGYGITQIQVIIKNLSGKTIFDSGWVTGNSYNWPLIDNQSRRGRIVNVSNGVYLFQVNAKGIDNVVSSPLIKLAVLKGKINTAQFSSNEQGQVSFYGRMNEKIIGGTIYATKKYKILPVNINDINQLFSSIIANSDLSVPAVLSSNKKELSANFNLPDLGNYHLLAKINGSGGKVYYQLGNASNISTNFPPVLCQELYPGKNNASANKINLIFYGSGYSSINSVIDIAKRIVDYNGTGKGLFYFEPFNQPSNKTRFNFWYLNQVGDRGFPDSYSLPYDIEKAINDCALKNYFLVVLYNSDFRSWSYFGPNAFSAVSWPEGSDETLVAVHELGHLIGNLEDEYIEIIARLPNQNRLSLSLSNIYTESGGHDVFTSSCINNANWRLEVGSGCGSSSSVDCIKDVAYKKFTLTPQGSDNYNNSCSSPGRPCYKSCAFGVPCYVRQFEGSECDIKEGNCYSRDKCDDNDNYYNCFSVYTLYSLACRIGTQCLGEVYCFEGGLYRPFDYFKSTFLSMMGNHYLSYQVLFQKAFGPVNIRLIQSVLYNYTNY